MVNYLILGAPDSSYRDKIQILKTHGSATQLVFTQEDKGVSIVVKDWGVRSTAEIERDATSAIAQVKAAEMAGLTRASVWTLSKEDYRAMIDSSWAREEQCS